MKYQLAIRLSQTRAAIIKNYRHNWNYVLIEDSTVKYPREYYTEIHYYNPDGYLKFITANFESKTAEKLRINLGELLDSDEWQPYDNSLPRAYTTWRNNIDRIKQKPKPYSKEWYLENEGL